VGERQEAISCDHRRQQRAALGGRAQGGDQAAAEHDRSEIRLHDEVPAECFHQDGELDRAAAGAAVLRRKRQAEPAERGELGPQPAVEALFARGDPLERAIVVALAQEFLGAVAQDRVLGIVSQVHGVFPRHGTAAGSGGRSPPGRIPVPLSSTDRGAS
jgi:hypothetical protein